jgi:hypothetical protein
METLVNEKIDRVTQNLKLTFVSYKRAAYNMTIVATAMSMGH